MRTISEGQAIELLHTHFDLGAPVAFEDVKKKYRLESKRLHPDAGGTDEAFKAFSVAFDKLKQLYQLGSPLFDAKPLEEVVEGEPQPPSMPRTTVDGTPLSELGLGLGPTTNGRECTRCEHRGYTITKEYKRGRCQKCSGSGKQSREHYCHPCRGTGKFTQRRSLRVVDCRACNGTGKFQHPFQKEWCSACEGTGRATTDHVANIYAMKCHECKGTGETEVWNPVLPKGRLGFAGKQAAAQVVTVSPPPPPKKESKGNKCVVADANLMQNLLRELQRRGIGGRR